MESLIKRSDAIEFAEYSHIEALTKEERIVWIMDIPSAEPTVDKDYLVNLIQEAVYDGEACKRLIEMVEPKQGEWIPCSERLPEDLEIVNITWVNHRPMNYYADIKDKPFVATAIHHRDRWWWYSPICEDMLAEYGKSECDKMDADIEVIAWQPLPEPYMKGADNE